jgi:hypothetical protein
LKTFGHLLVVAVPLALIVSCKSTSNPPATSTNLEVFTVVEVTAEAIVHATSNTSYPPQDEGNSSPGRSLPSRRRHRSGGWISI